MRISAMHAAAARPPIRRHLAWLLWLALLLPIAQTAGAWHTLSHTRADAGDLQDKQALHQTQCDLCLAVAAIAGGALTGQPEAIPHLTLRHAAPQHATASVWLASAPQVYRSRAPPLASH